MRQSCTQEAAIIPQLQNVVYWLLTLLTDVKHQKKWEGGRFVNLVQVAKQESAYRGVSVQCIAAANISYLGM